MVDFDTIVNRVLLGLARFLPQDSGAFGNQQVVINLAPEFRRTQDSEVEAASLSLEEVRNCRPKSLQVVSYLSAIPRKTIPFVFVCIV